MSLAVDRDLIVKELWRGRGIVPNSPIAKGDNHYDTSLPALKYDPKVAREHLKKPGYKGDEIVIETSSVYMADDNPMPEAVLAMKHHVSINGNIVRHEDSRRTLMKR